MYVDFAASGRPLPQIEAFITQFVHPMYANTHTETAGACWLGGLKMAIHPCIPPLRTAHA
jgi:hypothetical protein